MSATTNNPYPILSETTVLDPATSALCKAVDDDLFASANGNGLAAFFGGSTKKKALVIVMEQLGDFSSAEYAQLLCAVLDDLEQADIALRIIGIGNEKTAAKFSNFTSIPLSCIRMSPTAAVHEALGCHRGPNWDVPSWFPDFMLPWFAFGAVPGTLKVDEEYRSIVRAWLNYLAMCAGIAAPGTLREILRGYFGDKTSPERLASDEVVTAGPISIKGVTDVKIGPIEYQSLWKSETGYQRPAELATVRLRSMVEVLSNLNEYVPDLSLVDWRGATFLFDTDGTVLYEYKEQGVLTYSATMNLPLLFLSPYLGDEKARNPLGLGFNAWDKSV